MSDKRRKEIGEGDRESARRYNKHAREFVEDARHEGRDLRPDDDDEELNPDGLTEAEKAARERAREQDPQVSRDYTRPTKSSNR